MKSLDTLMKLRDLLELDWSKRADWAIDKSGPVGLVLICDVCDRTWSTPGQNGARFGWRDNCPWNSQHLAVFEMRVSGNAGEITWDQWPMWESGRIMFEKDIMVPVELWHHWSKVTTHPYQATKVLFEQKRILDRLHDEGYTIVLREPTYKEQHYSMAARYERAFIWQFRFPEDSRTWNLFKLGDHMELRENVSKLIAEWQSSDESESFVHVGSLDDDTVKELRRRCFEMKSQDKQLGEGAFRLLAQLTNLRRQAIDRQSTA